MLVLVLVLVISAAVLVLVLDCGFRRLGGSLALPDRSSEQLYGVARPESPYRIARGTDRLEACPTGMMGFLLTLEGESGKTHPA